MLPAKSNSNTDILGSLILIRYLLTHIKLKTVSEWLIIMFIEVSLSLEDHNGYIWRKNWLATDFWRLYLLPIASLTSGYTSFAAPMMQQQDFLESSKEEIVFTTSIRPSTLTDFFERGLKFYFVKSDNDLISLTSILCYFTVNTVDPS